MQLNYKHEDWEETSRVIQQTQYSARMPSSPPPPPLFFSFYSVSLFPLDRLFVCLCASGGAARESPRMSTVFQRQTSVLTAGSTDFKKHGRHIDVDDGEQPEQGSLGN